MKHIISLVLLTITSLSVMAQSPYGVAIGGEIGTGGAGVSVVVPLLPNRLYVGLGYNCPKVNISRNFEVDANVNGYIEELNSKSRASQIPYLDDDKVTLKGRAKIDFEAFQAKLYYYPSSNTRFFFAGGVRMGSEEFVSISATVDNQSWNTYQQAVNVNRQLPAEMRVNGLETALRYNLDDRTFQISPDQTVGRVDASLRVRKFSPYIGIGSGRVISQKHWVSFQFEFGAWYMGKAELQSDNEVAYDASADGTEDVLKYLDWCQWYPQITFRLTGRLF